MLVHVLTLKYLRKLKNSMPHGSSGEGAVYWPATWWHTIPLRDKQNFHDIFDKIALWFQKKASEAQKSTQPKSDQPRHPQQEVVEPKPQPQAPQQHTDHSTEAKKVPDKASDDRTQTLINKVQTLQSQIASHRLVFLSPWLLH